MNRTLLTTLLVGVPMLVAAQRQRSTSWESGVLEKGEKVGEWEYFSYSAKGERIVTQRYDHTTKQMLYCRPDDKVYQIETSPDHLDRTLLTQPPWFIGGHEALAAYTSKLDYPEAAQAGNVEGRVVVSFRIDTLGHASAHHVVQGIGSGCDEEALRISRTVPDEWVPGRLDGRAVIVLYELPFTFRLK